jgi:hypothetical protein
VLLQSLGKGNGLVVVVRLHTVTESLVVLFLNEQIIDSIVHSTLVLCLHVEQEGLDERDVVGLLKHAHNAVCVNAGGKSLQQICDQGRLLLQVEVKSLVVDLQIGDLDDGLLEGVVLPSISSALHHCKSSVVELVVVSVKEDKLGPKVSFLASLQDLGNVQPRPENAQMLHDTLGVVLRERNTELSKQAHVCDRVVSK